jgi:putative tryptophan/tyrosine transport system substrate-binding protein
MRRRQFITLLGGTAAWPFATSAQQSGKLPTIGFLNSAAPDDWAPNVAAFREGLSDAGYMEGRNLSLVFRFAEYHYDRLPAMALDLVRQGVDVILASGGDNSIKAAMAATNASLSRPGSNVTGVTFLASSLEAKRLELLHEIAIRRQRRSPCLWCRRTREPKAIRARSKGQQNHSG